MPPQYTGGANAYPDPELQHAQPPIEFHEDMEESREPGQERLIERISNYVVLRSHDEGTYYAGRPNFTQPQLYTHYMSAFNSAAQNPYYNLPVVVIHTFGVFHFEKLFSDAGIIEKYTHYSETGSVICSVNHTAGLITIVSAGKLIIHLAVNYRSKKFLYKDCVSGESRGDSVDDVINQDAVANQSQASFDTDGNLVISDGVMKYSVNGVTLTINENGAIALLMRDNSLIYGDSNVFEYYVDAMTNSDSFSNRPPQENLKDLLSITLWKNCNHRNIM